jgi:hypothetical protein
MQNFKMIPVGECKSRENPHFLSWFVLMATIIGWAINGYLLHYLACEISNLREEIAISCGVEEEGEENVQR